MRDGSAGRREGGDCVPSFGSLFGRGERRVLEITGRADEKLG